MPDAFFTVGGLPRAVTSIRRGANGQPQSLNASIADGDTVGVHAEGSGSVRFLGIDTPEKSFELPGSAGARRLDSAEWESYLTDPFLPQFGPFALDSPLADHLHTRIGAGAGVNHGFHGDNAEQSLIALVQSDMTALGQDLNTVPRHASSRCGSGSRHRESGCPGDSGSAPSTRLCPPSPRERTWCLQSAPL